MTRNEYIHALFKFYGNVGRAQNDKEKLKAYKQLEEITLQYLQTICKRKEYYDSEDRKEKYQKAKLEEIQQLNRRKKWKWN